MKGKFTGYVAGGELYGISSIRIGYSNWEIGWLHRFNSNIMGIIRNLNAGNKYLGLGVAYSNNDQAYGDGVSGSIVATMGADWTLMKWIYFRPEMFAVADYRGHGYAGVNIGLMFAF